MEFEQLLDGMDVGLVVLDRDWRYVYANDYALKIMEKRKEEIIGGRIWNLYAEVVGTVFETNYRQTMDERVPTSFEAFFPSLNLWFDVYTYPFKEGIAVRYSDITGHKKEEESLRESEKGFAGIFNASPAPAVIIRRKDGAYLEVNRAFEAASGFTRAEVIGKPPEELSVFPDRRLREELLLEVAQKGVVFNREFVLRGKGDRKIIGLVSIISLTFRGQECFLFIGIDITDRKKMEDAVTESNSLLETFIAYAPGIIVIMDDRLSHLKINKAAAELIGKTPGDILGKTYEEVMPQTMARRNLPQMQEILRTGRPMLNFEVAFYSPRQTEPFYLLSNRYPIPLPGGKRGIGIFSINITDRKKAEDTLRRNEYELRTLVDNTPDIIFRVNRRMQYVYVNPAYERVTGISKERFIGRTNAELGMSQTLVDLWQSAAQNVFESGRDHWVEFELSSFFGNRYFDARLIPDFDKTGVVDTVLVIARDKTDQKRCEKEIASLRE
jgi:PAS domain S-box-containing protein